MTTADSVELEQAVEALLKAERKPPDCHLLDEAGNPLCGAPGHWGVFYGRAVAGTDPCVECGGARCHLCAHPEGQG